VSFSSIVVSFGEDSLALVFRFERKVMLGRPLSIDCNLLEKPGENLEDFCQAGSSGFLRLALTEPGGAHF
jgi:hypothetical protein